MVFIQSTFLEYQVLQAIGYSVLSNFFTNGTHIPDQILAKDQAANTIVLFSAKNLLSLNSKFNFNVLTKG